MMKWPTLRYKLELLLLLVVTFILVHQFGQVKCCLEEERLALLDIKAYMKSYSNPNFITNPWFESRNGNCCKWSEVNCNAFTGRVTKLDLNSKVARDDEDAMKMPWLFNVTLFRRFSQLVSLDLSNNSINGLIEADGSTKISTLKNLRVLKLDSNNFGTSSISVSELTLLKTLSLFGANLNEHNFPLYQELANLRELQVLDLSYNTFYGYDIGTWLCSLRNLQELYLSTNNFKGGIPPCINTLTSLQILDLSQNQLSKELPSFSNLKFLRSLMLYDNNFEGKFSLSTLANHSNLQRLSLSRNNLQLQTEDVLWRPTFQLQMLTLSECSLNEPHGNIPSFLLHQYNLSYISLFSNNMVGTFPSWLLTNNSHLQTLYLYNNSFTGYLQFPHHMKPLHELIAISISNNLIYGELPETIDFLFPNLTSLYLSRNFFQGRIPSSISRLKKLELLDFSHNEFSGELPSMFFSDLSSLKYLELSDNNLEGDIIPDYMNLSSLIWLKLGNNHFGGKIKDPVMKCSSTLQIIDISNNNVIGRLPHWIGNFTVLTVLSVSNNFLQGQIPKELSKMELSFLDISENNFTGKIPSFSNHSILQYLHLHKNNLEGSMSDVLANLSQLTTLDLADNHLTGNIPWWINKFPSLRILQLGGNKLKGQVPLQMCDLSNIDILDMSYNSLSGEVPACFGNMSFGKRSIVTTIPSIYTIQEEVNVLVKNDYLTYIGGKAGNQLIMSAFDISCNKLTGLIPSELGELEHIHSLNLSHNYLSGSIPSSFANLKQIEGLDLSFNNLSGRIPEQLVELNTLEIFNVSYNNLSGRVPTTGQFGGFDERNYLGNPGLFGFPGSDLRNHTQEPPPIFRIKDGGDHDGSFLVDFLWSFGMSCATIYLATIVALYINPPWLQACFDFVDWYLLWWLPMSCRYLY